jgi:uncharacterized protein (DUF1778 family)
MFGTLLPPRVYCVYMRQRQVNVRLTEEEYRTVRYWAYKTEKSLSDLARDAMLEAAERLAAEELSRSAQPTLELR